MNFEFSEEQLQLGEALAGFFAKEYTFEHFRTIGRSAAGWDLRIWQKLAELGVLGINVPSEFGGLGYGALETLVLMNACGSSLPLEPIVSSAVIAPALLRGFTGDATASRLLTATALGEHISVLAHFEPGARFATQSVSTLAVSSAGGYRLNGHKATVQHAGLADTLLVSARTASNVEDAHAVSLFCVPRTCKGVRLEEYLTLDGQRAADVHLQDVELPPSSRLGAAGTALAPIEAAIDFGLAAVCAEAVGIMQAVINATINYLRTRQQFGQPIGNFQALQHRVADMVIHMEQARSMSYLAALRGGSTDIVERRCALSAAKVVIGDACRFVGQQSVQLHGGMGMTDELQISHWFKRLTAIDIVFGDSDTHLQRYAALTRDRLEG
jgi:alkylation response protein AidB-like acyl-CoA dehydrogenase